MFPCDRARGVRGSAISELIESLDMSGFDRRMLFLLCHSVWGNILNQIVYFDRSDFFAFYWIIFVNLGGNEGKCRNARVK